ncbi:hypothetical protein HY491_01280 [Candidatus Woesearchaeota archaeon]|nr:hypothetical protein [Candidatus Woesearchaeota archaeon]
MKWSFLFPFGVLLFALAAAAQGFTASFPRTQYTACDCEPITSSFAITNTASTAQLFRIEAAGAAASWLKLPGTQFRLQPGQKADIPFQLQSPCSIQGNYDLQLIIRAQDKAQRYLLNIAINRCPNIGVTAEKSSAALCSGDTAAFSVRIQNTRTFQESYAVSLTDFQDTAKASFTAATIYPNKSAPLTISIPVSRQPGTYNFSLVTKTAYSRLTATTPLSLTVLPCDSFAISLPENITLCQDNAQEFTIPVTSTGSRPVTASFSFAAPPWVSMQPDSLSIAPGASSAIMLSINPLQSGRHQLRITGTGREVSTASSSLIVISRKQCVLPAMDAADDMLTITNTGLFSGNYSLATSPDIGISRILSLAPGESASISLPQEGERKSVSVTLTADGQQYAKRIALGQPFSLAKLKDAGKRIWLPIADFFIAYWLMILIGIAVLAALLFLIRIAARLKSKRLEKELLQNEQPKPKEQKPREIQPAEPKPKKAAAPPKAAKRVPARKFRLPLVHPAILITLIAAVALALVYLLVPAASSFIREQWKFILAAVAALIIVSLLILLLWKYRRAGKYAVTALVLLLAGAFVVIRYRAQAKELLFAAWRSLQDFLALYGSYIILGVVLLLIIIFFLRLGKGEHEPETEKQEEPAAAKQVKRAKRK